MSLTDLQARSDHLILPGALLALKGGYYEATLTGALVLDTTYPSVIALDPGGSTRTVDLEGDAAGDGAHHGKFRLIINKANAAESLTVRDAAATTIGTVAQNKAGLFYHDEGSGWALCALFTTTLS
jgi:hypothetical protein